jgi:hypothetical protein
MAAPTRVQSTGRVRALSTLSVSLTFASPPTAGNTIVAAAIAYTAVSSFTGADNRGNSYTQVAKLTTGQVSIVMFACTTPLVTGSPFTVTLTANTPVYWEACAIEVTGAGGTGVLTVDQTITQSGAGPTVSTGTTAALTGTDVFVLAGHAIAGNQTSITVQSVSPAWFQEFENLDYSASIAGELDTRSLTGVAGTTQSCSWTTSNVGPTTAALVVFKGTGVTPPPTTLTAPTPFANCAA